MRHEIPGGMTTAVVYGGYPDEGEMRQLHAMLSTEPFKDAHTAYLDEHDVVPDLTALVQATGIPRGTVRRALNSFAHTGFRRGDDRVLVRHREQNGSRYEWREAV